MCKVQIQKQENFKDETYISAVDEKLIGQRGARDPSDVISFWKKLGLALFDGSMHSLIDL